MRLAELILITNAPLSAPAVIFDFYLSQINQHWYDLLFYSVLLRAKSAVFIFCLKPICECRGLNSYTIVPSVMDVAFDSNYISNMCLLILCICGSVLLSLESWNGFWGFRIAAFEVFFLAGILCFSFLLCFTLFHLRINKWPKIWHIYLHIEVVSV